MPNCSGCKDCTKRHVGCHSDCSDYHIWKQEYEQQKAERQKQRSLDKNFGLGRYRAMAEYTDRVKRTR